MVNKEYITPIDGEYISKIEGVIKENEENSEMLFAIYTGGMSYQPYMKKDGTSANLVITGL